MLEDKVAFLLQKYLGNYVRGFNKEALKISVWRGDVELTNMQLKPEALNALKLPVKVKAGFLGSVRLKVPWSRLGQEPVLVYLDRIFILAEPATQVQGCSEDAIQEAKKTRVQELESKLLESQQQLKSEMNTSWLGSLVNTIIGNLKLSISNVHIRYEDAESNPGHPFAAGLMLSKLSAVTIDDLGKETFVTGGALERIQKSVELESLAIYFDSDICPWSVNKAWEDLLPSEWNKIFKIGIKDDAKANLDKKEHSYVLEPVTGNAKYRKLQLEESKDTGQALQKAAVNLDNVTLSLSKAGYGDILKMAENFAAFNQRLKYAHYRPSLPIKSDPRSWWKYAYKVITDEAKKASGKLSWEQVLHYARLRKRYISLYASLLQSDLSRTVVDNNEEIEKLDRELDIQLIIQWRMLAHKFVEQALDSDIYRNEQKSQHSWWSFGWSGTTREDSEHRVFMEEDWEQLNKIIGYKEDSDNYLMGAEDKGVIHFCLEVHMKRNASKLIWEGQECLAELACDGLACSMKTYSEAKVFDLNLGSYRLSSPYGLLAESANTTDSLVGVFAYKPFDAEVDWSLVAKASPCYVTYRKEWTDQIVAFFKTSAPMSQTLASETVAAVQMTINGVKRSAQQQVTRVLKEQSRFLLDLDIAAPKITIPTKFCPDDLHATRLLLDLGNLVLRTEDIWEKESHEDKDLYVKFNFVLSDVSAFLVDGEYQWGERFLDAAVSNEISYSYLPVVEKCAIMLKFQQIQSESPFYPSTRIAVRLPSLAFHFSPARYHRLMQVAKIFQEDESSDMNLQPWNHADFEGWFSLLAWKGVGNREAVWQRRYVCLVGPFLYILESPISRTYKQYISLNGKQVHQVQTDYTDGAQNILALHDAGQSNQKVVESSSALIFLCDDVEHRKAWQSRLQGAIYRATGSPAINTLPDSPSGDIDSKSLSSSVSDVMLTEKLFVTGVLNELKICFSCCYEGKQTLKDVLLSKEDHLFEFRAAGGHVEVSIKSNIILVGTILRSLEIEDQYCCKELDMPRYLARSFVDNIETSRSSSSSLNQEIKRNSLSKSGSEDKFFEALEDLDSLNDTPSSQKSMLKSFSTLRSLPSSIISLGPPNFCRVPALIPDIDLPTGSLNSEKSDTLHSFVKARMIIYDQRSPSYANIDNKVMVSLATLSFFCHRPTIGAILNFTNAINILDGNTDSEEFTGITLNSVLSTPKSASSDRLKAEEPVVKELVWKNKKRVVFHLTLNMATAQIFLMNETGSSLVTLSQNNLVADIKVFPSSYRIKAALGNLKISDDSLPDSHSYFWVCDMRNPEGSSFVELEFSSFSIDDEGYSGYDYSLVGRFSEVRIVYLNRFVNEIVGYFMGLVPNNPDTVVKLKDHVTDSEKWFSQSEIEGSPALKLDISLDRPIILLPQRTDSMDYLELDVLHITVKNTFQWIGGDKNDLSAVHMETLIVKVEDINLTVGSSNMLGETIIHDVEGLSIVVRRSLRDLLHQIPSTEVTVQIDTLKAALSNREYEIITECASSNFSETPHIVPALNSNIGNSGKDALMPSRSLSEADVEPETQSIEAWITLKVVVAIHLIELSLHSGLSRDSPLARIKAMGAWLLYKSNTSEEDFLFATLKGFSIIDDREGTKDELRLAIGNSNSIQTAPSHFDTNDDTIHQSDDSRGNKLQKHDIEPVPSMLILDIIFRKASTKISLGVQRPRLLVALDFLFAVAEFFSPSVRNILSDEEDTDPLHITDAVILSFPTYIQPSPIHSLSSRKPLIVDGENLNHFIYDGKGGKLYLQDRAGKNLSCPSSESIIYVGNGKRLQFKNVTIMNGEYLDSCIFLGTNSSYSASEADCVVLKGGETNDFLDFHEEREGSLKPQTDLVPSEIVLELQAIGSELTFYNSSKDVSVSSVLSKTMHAQLDVFSKFIIKGNSFEVSAMTLGFTVESNGIRVLEPFDTSFEFSNTSGKTNIHFSISDIYMNFTFSILRVLLAFEEDILAFLRRSSKKALVVCTQFNKIFTVQNHLKDQTYAFWRPQAPSGFAVLGDCLTPLNEAPTKGVIAVNTTLVKVKRPISYRLIWTFSANIVSDSDSGDKCSSCSIWFPIAPNGYVPIGCVVAVGDIEPPLSSGLCVLASLVSPSMLKDCIALNLSETSYSNMVLWRAENSFGSFLPADPTDMSLVGKPYELRHVLFGQLDSSASPFRSSTLRNIAGSDVHSPQLETTRFLTSGRLFEAVATFKLIWWNQGITSQKRLSIWRPVIPPGMVFLGDIAVQGYEPPNIALLLHGSGDEDILKVPQDFQLVGHIKKQKGVESISFWLPQAPPGFVALGCVASKNSPKIDDLSSLRCIRSDMVTGDQFAEDSIWDTSESRVSAPFSLWGVGSNFGTFLVRNGFKKPPRRFALNIAGPSVSSSSDDTVIDGEIKAFSAAVLDDYGGLMVPLFNVSLDKISYSLHGRKDYMNSSASFSLCARSFNDKYDAWEPLIEPFDGFLRYQYDLNAPGASTQVRMTSTRDMNLNVSVSNANMIIQAYSSWNNLNQIDVSYNRMEAVSPTHGERSIINVQHRRNHYIVPQNKLGQDIYIRTTGHNKILNIVKLPSGDSKRVKVPVSRNMMDSHLKWKQDRLDWSMATVVIADAEVPVDEGIGSHEYMLAVRLSTLHPTGLFQQQQSARTCGVMSKHSSHGTASVVWNEMFFFKVDTMDNYMVEFIVTDLVKGEPIGIHSCVLKHIAVEAPFGSYLHDSDYKLDWKILSLEEMTGHQRSLRDEVHGKIRCAVLVQSRSEIKSEQKDLSDTYKASYIQISPRREGPWTNVRLNYASATACWRLGNDVVASEVTIRDGDKFVNIRSLVSVTNNTDFILDLRLKSSASLNLRSEEANIFLDRGHDDNIIETEEFFEIEIFVPYTGWVSCSRHMPITDEPTNFSLEGGNEEASVHVLPNGWEWIDDWHVDVASTRADGWVYALDVEHLKWPDAPRPLSSNNHARQRKWVRHRKYISSDKENEISLGLLAPGATVPVPLTASAHPVLSYILQLRLRGSNDSGEYSWSVALEKRCRTGISGEKDDSSEICVSALTESDVLLYSSRISETSSNMSRGLWFCGSVRPKEIGKDMNSDPIHDWNLIISSPLSLINYLPVTSACALTSMQPTGERITCCQDTLGSGDTLKIYSADIREPLYLSLIPEGGWQMINEPVLVSHPSKVTSKLLTLKSSFSGRIVQIVLEQYYDKDNLITSIVRIYTPYWISNARCPPLTYKITSLSRKEIRHLSLPYNSSSKTGKVLWQITEEEMVDGYTLASVINFKGLGLSASISKLGKECFGPVKDLSPLGDMDGLVDLYAYDTDGNCMRLLVSSKPCPYQAIPTKVINIRPFMTFTNRIGQDLFIRFNVDDQPKTLSAFDSRVSFSFYEAGGPDKLQIRLDETDWCFPLQIVKEDTITIVLRNHQGGTSFLRAEVRGYEEGSRFLVVFRLGPADGPLRFENRTTDATIKVRQCGFGDNSWTCLEPLSTARFSWDDPYGLRLLDVCLLNQIETCVQDVDIEKTLDMSKALKSLGIQLHVVDLVDVKILRFADYKGMLKLGLHEKMELEAIDSSETSLRNNVPSNTAPLELIIELGVVGVSLIDHKPREVLYLYLERVYLSYSTGFDAGKTSRFKLICGELQLDNQLPLTVMPVLLAPEDSPVQNHPVFKATITVSNETVDGTQVFPYVYIRVIEQWWKLNVHEPVIWALFEFYKNLRMDIAPSNSAVAQVDPEIQIGLIDVSEIRLKLSLETAPTQRPLGALGIWSPVFSAVGNAFKIQVHLRKVMHESRFMRRSSIFPAIVNRIRRDLIHNPFHLIFSVDVLGMTRSTLASLSKGFAELSTDGQFLQLRTKQVWSRRITGVSDGFLQGTEAFAQGVAFGVSGVVKKPVESARQHGFLGLAYGLGRAFLGFVVQPLSGALDFVSLTVDGIGASFTRCLEILNNKAIAQRTRNPRAILSDGVIREYDERQAIGQMVLYLAEASRHLGCTDLFKEPSKYAWSDYYEDHFIVLNQRIVLITNKRVMLLQCFALDKMDKRPCKILWDVPWDELLALELAKAGYEKPSHLIIHLKNFRRTENFVRLIKCKIDEQEEPQAVIICSAIRKIWKAHQADNKVLVLKVPSSQRHVQFSYDGTMEDLPHIHIKPFLKPRGSPTYEERRFIKHSLNFRKIWSSEREQRSRCTLLSKQVVGDGTVCSIWRPLCPDGYVSVGDIAHVGSHSPHVAAIYHNSDGNFALPLGYDLVWRNCVEDYAFPLTIWFPRAPDGYVALGCVAVAGYEEPQLDTAFCAKERIAEETLFEEEMVWTAPNSYPWACYIYQVKSEALQFIALRRPKEELEWKVNRVSIPQESEASSSNS